MRVIFRYSVCVVVNGVGVGSRVLLDVLILVFVVFVVGGNRFVVSVICMYVLVRWWCKGEWGLGLFVIDFC